MKNYTPSYFDLQVVEMLEKFLWLGRFAPQVIDIFLREEIDKGGNIGSVWTRSNGSVIVCHFV